MQQLFYLASLASLFFGIQSSNFATFLLTSLIAYVFMEAAVSLEKE